MKQKSLSKLEQQVMEIVWVHQESSVRNVLEEIKKDKEVAYTTVLTILQRLEEKGFVKKKEVGKMHVYLSKISKEAYSKTVAESFVHNFINSFGNIAIASFAESIDKLPKEKRKYLLTLLENHDKAK